MCFNVNLTGPRARELVLRGYAWWWQCFIFGCKAENLVSFFTARVCTHTTEGSITRSCCRESAFEEGARRVAHT